MELAKTSRTHLFIMVLDLIISVLRTKLVFDKNSCDLEVKYLFNKN